MRIYLETKRLIFREMSEADAPLLHALDSDPAVLRYLRSHPIPRELNAHLAHIRDTYLPYYAAGKGHGFWAVVERESAEFIGWFHLRPGLDYRFAAEAGYQADDLDLGYRLRRKFWKQGIATEGSQALVQRAFDQLGANRVVATALLANRPSTRVMEKVGMCWVQETHLPGFDEPAVTYALERSEHEAARRGQG
jgi:RimJ/RimL family protein N-acetyltransferase